jgi:hypothetical protein
MARRPVTYTSKQALEMIINSDSEISDVDLSDIDDDNDFIAADDIESETDDHVSEESSDSDEDPPSSTSQMVANVVDQQSGNTDSIEASAIGERSRRGRGRGRGRCRGRGRINAQAGINTVDQANQPASAPQSQVMTGKNGKVWNLTPPSIHKRGPQDIIRHHVGVTAEGKVQSIKAAFELFLTDEILDIIMRETNREANRVYRQWNIDHPEKPKTWKSLSMIELKAFVGLLILTGEPLST